MSYYQGETVFIEVEVEENGEPVELNGATAVFGLKKGTQDLVTKNCTVEGSTVTTKLEPSETTNMLGTYNYEVKVTDLNSDVDIVKKGKIKILKSIFIVQS